MKKSKRVKKPNMDGINLLVSILVSYPELGTVSFEPSQDSLRLSFTLKRMPSKEEYEMFRSLLEESIAAYHSLEKFFDARTSISLEGTETMAFLYVWRDVSTLSRGEIGLLTALVRDHFGTNLLMDMEISDADKLEIEMAQSEIIDNMIGNLKINRVTDRMIGVREEGRVMVFNK